MVSISLLIFISVNILGFSLFQWSRKIPANSFSFTKGLYLDDYELAFLAGGRQRTIDLAIVKLTEDRFIVPNADFNVLYNKRAIPVNSHPLEKHVIKMIATGAKVDEIQNSITTETRRVEDRLKRKSLIVNRSQRVTCTLTLLILAIASFNTLGDIPEYLYNVATLFMIIDFFFCAIYLAMFIGHRTKWGNHLLEKYRAEKSINVGRKFALDGYESLRLNDGSLNELTRLFIGLEQDRQEAARNACGC